MTSDGSDHADQRRPGDGADDEHRPADRPPAGPRPAPGPPTLLDAAAGGDGPALPRYGPRSLGGVLPALLQALGVPPRRPSDPGPDQDLVIPPVRAVALLLVDGLGSELLRRYPGEAPFLASLPDAGPLVAGFPSSTSISISSLGTGLPPGAHGMLGISFRVGKGELLDSLHWTTHGKARTRDLRQRFPPEDMQREPTEFERAAAAGITVRIVSQWAFRSSGLTRAALRGGLFRGTSALGEMAAEMIDAVTGPGRRLCYGYHSDLDSVGHAHGPGSLAWQLQLGQIDRLAALIAEHLPSDGLLAITGDHGMVRAERRYDADTDDALLNGVALLGGDPRARHVYAKRGAADDVLAAWRSVLGTDAWVVTGEQAVADGWFGPVAAHVRGRIGDVVVAARDSAAVIRSIAEPHISTMPGQHGSLSTAEQLVPLLLARSDDFRAAGRS